MSVVELVKYDAACRAVAEAKAIDEVKSIRDKAVAMQEYGRQSKNKNLEADALEIRMRATRRLGEMMEEGKDDRASEGRKEKRVFKKPVVPKPTLNEVGIDKNLAHQARTLARMSKDKFEKSVSEGRDKVTQVVKDVLTDHLNDKYNSKPDKGAPLFAEFGHSLAENLMKVLSSDKNAEKLEEIEHALPHVVLDEDKASLRLIISALEKLESKAADWRDRLKVGTLRSVPVSQLKEVKGNGKVAYK